MAKPTSSAWAAAIPPGLRALPQWVAHRNKKPEHPLSGIAARVNDPKTWGTRTLMRPSFSVSLFDSTIPAYVRP